MLSGGDDSQAAFKRTGIGAPVAAERCACGVKCTYVGTLKMRLAQRAPLHPRPAALDRLGREGFGTGTEGN